MKLSEYIANLQKIYESKGDLNVKIIEEIETYDLDTVEKIYDAQLPKVEKINGEKVVIINSYFLSYN